MTTASIPELSALSEMLDDELDAAIALRHELHADPEVGGHEYRTSARVAAAMGEPDAPAIAEGRIVRVGDSTSPVIAVRAELDALPGNETSGLPWASVNGAVHMCGHDVHLAALTAVVRTLRRIEPPAPLLAILQPREELSPGGAVDILASPLVRDLDVRAVIGVHVQPRLLSGTFSAAAGTVNASSDEFTITVRGHGGHGAYPHTTRDPVVAAAHTVTALQFIISRQTDPMLPAVITIGSLHGGQAPNVIPDLVELRGTLRAFAPQERERLQGEIARVAEQTAVVHGCSAEVEFSFGDPPLVNDARLSHVVSAAVSSLGLIEAEPLRSCGSDDFAHYGELFPSCMVFYGVGTGMRDEPGLHHPSFVPADEHVRGVAMTMLAAYLACC